MTVQPTIELSHTVDVFGVRFYSGDLTAAAHDVVDHAHGGAGGYGCLCNVHVLMNAQRDPLVHKALERAWNVFADGAPVAWAVRRAHGGTMGRVAGPDLMARVIELGQESGTRHFLYGSTPEMLALLIDSLRKLAPEAKIVGAIAPSFGTPSKEELASDLAAITMADPHIVWCGLGAPRQELWMRDNADKIAPALVLGVGAAFDFLAGTKRRAPLWMRQAGLEWLHRLISEPRRLGGRYLTTNSQFLVRAILDLYGRNNGRQPRRRSAVEGA